MKFIFVMRIRGHKIIYKSMNRTFFCAGLFYKKKKNVSTQTKGKKIIIFLKGSKPPRSYLMDRVKRKKFVFWLVGSQGEN